VLGGLLLLGGAGFITKNFCAVLAPQYDSMLLVLPMLVAMVGMAVWLPIKGIDQDRFEWLQTHDQRNN
jgi:dTDP-D-glucose 4,6-dehydratase